MKNQLVFLCKLCLIVQSIKLNLHAKAWGTVVVKVLRY